MKILLRLVPDLVVLDLMLPRFDGGEVLKFMQANPRLKTVPVIILSTNSIIDADEEYVLESASRRFIKGQCTFPMVLEAIQKLLAEAPANDNALAAGQPGNGLAKEAGENHGLTGTSVSSPGEIPSQLHRPSARCAIHGASFFIAPA